ncbi:MAG: SpoVA/SpoVAEb family sporulation membrane protein [Clostridia bacterium]|nr:SpoVA/SpoVAEb family sporulation membrane protein [Clostridia bacterium]MDY2714920.1 SpoVA/SpoVAEb family sporulation membrane protein [Christensenellaceae bacterium]
MEENRVNKNYLEYVSDISPKTNETRSLLHAFWVGGVICLVGQFIRFMLEYLLGLYGDELAGTTSIVLIFLGSLLTGLGVYDRIGKYAGGGSIVPITGFANSVVSPAMEFKSEGYIYGLAAKMFVIAGPIIVFGVIGSVAVGLVYYIAGLFL